ncbi:alpha/beta hydrolase [Thalassotalea sp. Y01]|uniref:alpha/beta hydrolase n=1 Tax=Thalassotalea sp. Y01 TaxID=2729613 RepID=UPI001B7D5F22|nr:alpha/beta hydrolase [Thalassotalea sp. Y01]
MIFIFALILALITPITFANGLWLDRIEDGKRGRVIPVELTLPVQPEQCQANNKCPVVLLSAGYGMAHNQYSFLATWFSQQGYLSVAVGHELVGDPPLSVTGKLYKTRSENWIRGAETLDVVRTQLSGQLSNYNFDELLLVGHSNGGDISAWRIKQSTQHISGIITLDHRRVPLPRNSDIKTLSIRASDFAADQGVLPTRDEQLRDGSCVITIADAKHNDMWDGGAEQLKADIIAIIKAFLRATPCQQIASR